MNLPCHHYFILLTIALWSLFSFSTPAPSATAFIVIHSWPFKETMNPTERTSLCSQPSIHQYLCLHTPIFLLLPWWSEPWTCLCTAPPIHVRSYPLFLVRVATTVFSPFFHKFCSPVFTRLLDPVHQCTKMPWFLPCIKKKSSLNLSCLQSLPFSSAWNMCLTPTSKFLPVASQFREKPKLCTMAYMPLCDLCALPFQRCFSFNFDNSPLCSSCSYHSTLFLVLGHGVFFLA